MKNAKWLSAVSYVTLALGFLGCADQNQKTEATELGNTTVSGQVLNGSGEPVPGATVYLHLGREVSGNSLEDISQLLKSLTLDSTKTDSKGHYDFGMVEDYFFLSIPRVDADNPDGYSYLPYTDAPEELELDLGNEESIEWEVFFVWIDGLHQYDPTAEEDILVSVQGGWVDLYGILPQEDAEYHYKVLGKIHGKLYLVSDGVLNFKAGEPDQGIVLPEGYSTVLAKVEIIPWVRQEFANADCKLEDLSIRLYQEEDGSQVAVKTVAVQEDGSFEIPSVSDGYYIAQAVGCKGFGAGQWYYIGDGAGGGEAENDAAWAREHRTIFIHQMRTEKWIPNTAEASIKSIDSVFYADGEWKVQGDTLFLQDYGDMDVWTDSIVTWWKTLPESVQETDTLENHVEKYGEMDRALRARILFKDGSHTRISSPFESQSYLWPSQQCSNYLCEVK